MSQPPPYNPSHSFVSDSATLGGFPGQSLDIEFNAIAAVTKAIEANLALIQRDDGALANGSVTYDQLSPLLQSSGIAPATAWVTGAIYSAGVSVFEGTNLYRASVTHTSGVFATDLASGKWLLVTALPSSISPVGAPIVLFFSGQSNPENTFAYIITVTVHLILECLDEGAEQIECPVTVM